MSFGHGMLLIKGHLSSTEFVNIRCFQIKNIVVYS